MKNIKLTTNYLKLNEYFYSQSKAVPLKNPKLISYNDKLSKELNISADIVNSEDFTSFVNGEYLANGSNPFAMAYCGHQFGYFVNNLGDGRALNLGKLYKYNLQLKGAGVTSYSRNGDGRAVLRSSIREYLLSVAMDGLNIPTTKALAIISSDSKAFREETESCAIVMRASTSWVRFGTFERAYIDKENNEQKLKELANYVIEESYNELENVENKYEEMYFKIVDRTIEMIALWQSVGFMHGVMNTDNMSIEGLTIDYGPFAFMEEFSKDYICNHSDHEGRYRFENQAFIAQWNLTVLAQVLSPIANHEIMTNYNDQFIGRFKKRYFEIMASKLGFKEKYKEDTRLILDMFLMLDLTKLDYTPFFYFLSCGKYDEIISMSLFQDETKAWLEDYKERLEKENIKKEELYVSMKKINPKYILKNYMLQEVIKDAEDGDFQLLNDMLEVAKNPYGEHIKYERYSKPTPKDVGGFICSCSS